MKLLLNDGDQHIGGYGAPDLRFHRILGRAQKTLDTQMLLDPFEKQLHLPAALVQRGNGQWRECRIVGQKHQRLARLGVFESNAPQMLRVVLGHVKTVEPNRLIADHPRTSVGLGRVHALGIHPAFGSGYKECPRLMQLEESAEVQITAIHHIKSPRFDGQNVEYIDVAHPAIADVNESWNRAAQIQQRMHLYRRFGAAKRCPVEQAQTQVDGGRVQCVDRRIESQSCRFLGVEVAGSPDQAHGQFVINAPVPLIQSVRKRGSGRHAVQTHVKQFALVGGKTRLDVAQRLAPRQLREGHYPKQIGAIQGAHSSIATITIDDTSEGFPRHILHDLRKQRLAHVHASLQVHQT